MPPVSLAHATRDTVSRDRVMGPQASRGPLAQGAREELSGQKSGSRLEEVPARPGGSAPSQWCLRPAWAPLSFHGSPLPPI